MRRRALIHWPLAAGLALHGLPSRAEEGPVWILLSGSRKVYTDLAQTLQQGLRGTKGLGDTQLFTLPDALPSSTPRLVITAGAGALRAVLDQRVDNAGLRQAPVLATLLPRASFDAATRNRAERVHGVLLDQPPERYLDLIRLALPEHRRVGVLLGPDTLALRSGLTEAARVRGLELVASSPALTGEDVYAGLQQLLGKADVLLALPDNTVFGTSHLQHILTATYRRRMPVVGYAEVQVWAGATLALQASPTQVAEQTLQAVRQLLSAPSQGRVDLARDFAVFANEEVLRSLGLKVPSAPELNLALQRLEQRR